ncbi:MAG: hypothetical protein M1401_06900 [Chloroflexi bacterium]|nr:hypothetical protein [Chloroflexota bacterium]
MRRCALALLWLALTLSASPATAQVQQVQLGVWQPVGFKGIRVDALAAAEEGRVLYVATELGLQASVDGGENWNFVGGDLESLGAPPVLSLAVDPRDSGLVYAGTEPGPKGGLYVSRDGGLHWQWLFRGQNQEGVRTLLVAGQPGSIYLSTWPLGGAVDELLGTADGGQSWRVLLPAASAQAGRRLFAVSLGEGDRLFVAGSDGVQVSVAGGEHWRRALGRPTYSLAVATVDGEGGVTDGRHDILYAANEVDVATSVDGGASWRQLVSPVECGCGAMGPNSLALSVGRVPVVLAGANATCDYAGYVRVLGTNKYTGDEAWGDGSAGLPALREYRFVVAGEARPRAYALTPEGVWSLDLPVSASAATPVSGLGAMPVGASAPQPAPDSPLPSGALDGALKELAGRSSLDYTLVGAVLAVGCLITLRRVRGRPGH